MIEQLLAHLVGDYIFQTHRMAVLKREKWSYAIAHAITYTAAFTWLTRDWCALLIIGGTHAIIDHFGLAKYVVRAKNSIGDWENRNDYATHTGFPIETPVWLSVWLVIIVDNILHLLINYCALGYFR